MFGEIPYPNEIYDYNKYITPDYILEGNEKDVVDNLNDSKESENTFKLIV